MEIKISEDLKNIVPEEEVLGMIAWLEKTSGNTYVKAGLYRYNPGEQDKANVFLNLGLEDGDNEIVELQLHVNGDNEDYDSVKENVYGWATPHLSYECGVDVCDDEEEEPDSDLGLEGC